MVFLLACVATLVMWPSTASAQHYGGHARASSFVVVGGGFYRPYYFPFYAGWYPAWYGFYGAYPPYGYWYGGSYASVRLQVTPKQAEVYLDGYYVGVVDDFDGVFQRLDTPTGQHELQVYMQGYKSLNQKMLFRPGQTYKVSAVLQPIAPGDPPEPRPVAAPRPQRQYQGPPPGYEGPQGGYPPPPEAYPPPAEGYPPPPSGRAQPPAHQGEMRTAPGTTFGTIAIRVQPADAVVVIDGERWDSPDGGSRLQIQLSVGPHHVEISKDGYKTYSTSVTVRDGETTTLNVSLSNGGGLTGAAIFSN